ncbi:MAG TPA: hypothetical protein PLO87_09315 [Ornithinibacter sp.]|nr:hypothetical protein [Ornithinibacter sp.]
MSSSTTLKAVLIGEDRSMGRTFDNVGRKADGAGRKTGGFGKSFALLAGPIGAGIAAIGLGGAALGKFTDFLGSSVAEARESEKVGKTTAQIIKATGGAAKVSAGQVGALAESLSEKAGVDDEVIQTGANLLLTFKNVRNEAGQGSAIFDRATAAAVDLSASGFGSVDSSAKMLGKALNDPLKGISALSRAGVTFTQQQKDQIKVLVESGDVLGAQKIILGEVESQVGGVAAASATMGEKVKVSWDNLKEQVGTALLPALDKLGKWFLETGLPAIKRFGGWIADRLWPALKEGWQTILPGLTRALDILTGGTGDGEMSWKKFGDIITEKVIPFIAKLTNVYLPAWAAQIRTMIVVVGAAWGAFKTWASVVASVVSTMLRSFATLMRGFATLLRGLSKIPGFGWAKDAADKLDGAADKADGLAAAIRRIPGSKSVGFTALTGGAVSQISVLQRKIDSVTGKSVTVRVRYVTEGRLPSGGLSYAGGSTRASGGPVVKGWSYLVGENGPEIWSGDTGRITPARQTAQILSGRGASGGGSAQGGGDVLITNVLQLDGHEVHRSLKRVRRQSGPLGLA